MRFLLTTDFKWSQQNLRYQRYQTSHNCTTKKKKKSRFWPFWHALKIKQNKFVRTYNSSNLFFFWVNCNIYGKGEKLGHPWEAQRSTAVLLQWEESTEVALASDQDAFWTPTGVGGVNPDTSRQRKAPEDDPGHAQETVSWLAWEGLGKAGWIACGEGRLSFPR